MLVETGPHEAHLAWQLKEAVLRYTGYSEFTIRPELWVFPFTERVLFFSLNLSVQKRNFSRLRHSAYYTWLGKNDVFCIICFVPST